ncbi:MAG: hypothetical protein M1820_003398 [Bogoriella megaspora]|nr:MAG: hypothetical protein M1820_003398 [Bogoriella megaspora]
MSAKTYRNPPFRAEHLGSLLRPKELIEKRQAFEKKEISIEELTKVEDEDIKDIVKIQLDAGLHSISDGEYRRHQFWGTFFPNLEGMSVFQNPTIDLFRVYLPDIAAFTETEHNPEESVICTGKIKHTGKTDNLHQYEYLKSLLPKERWGEIKMTLPAPEWYHLRYKEGLAYKEEAYSNDEDYFNDLAIAYQAELEILYNAGLRNVQIDDPNMAYFCSEKMLAGWKEDKTNKRTADEQLDAYIGLYNKCIEKHIDKMHIGLHICRGNFVGSRHFSEGGYDRIAIKLFQNLNVSTFYLEYDTPRAGGFEPLAHLPVHKNVICGVVTSKFPKLEDKSEMVERVLNAADYVAKGAGQTREQALDRIGVSPQCGFASHVLGNALGIEDMKKKLQLVRSIADEIWPGQP